MYTVCVCVFVRTYAFVVVMLFNNAGEKDGRASRGEDGQSRYVETRMGYVRVSLFTHS